MAYEIIVKKVNITSRKATKEEIASHVVEARLWENGLALDVDLFYGNNNKTLQRAGTITVTNEQLIKQLKSFGSSSDELLQWAKQNLPERMASPTMIIMK